MTRRPARRGSLFGAAADVRTLAILRSFGVAALDQFAGAADEADAERSVALLDDVLVKLRGLLAERRGGGQEWE